MSVKAMSWAFDQAIPPGPKIVLLAVADRTWDDAGHWSVNWHELEARCSLARRTIKRYLLQLHQNKLVTLAHRFDQRSGVQLTNLCVLHRERNIHTPSDWGEGTNDGILGVSGETTTDGLLGDLLRHGEGTHDGAPLNPSSSSLLPESGSETSKSPVSGRAPDEARSLWIVAEGILEFLNRKTGKHYQSRKPNKDPTASLTRIHSLLKAGYREEQLRQVIGNRLVKWGDDPKMQEFLRPETLFGPTKFEQYLGELGKTDALPQV